MTLTENTQRLNGRFFMSYKKPAKKPKRGTRKGRPAPAIVLRGESHAPRNAVTIEVTPSGPRGGRPAFKLTPELSAEICSRIATGATVHTLGDDLPNHDVIRRWREEYDWFSVAYMRAVEDRSDFWASEIKVIADTTQEGVKTEIGPLGVKEIRADMIEHRKLRIDARKWLMAKATPKRYGDKLDLNVGGQPDGAPIRSVALTTTDPVEAERLYREALTGAKD